MTRILSACTFLLCLAGAPSLAAQQFGGSLAVSGDQVFIGETGNQTLSGIVYVFTEQGGEWTEGDQLRITDELRSPDGFGRALAAGDGWMLAGAPLENDGAGGLYLFRRSADGTWTRAGRMIGSGAGAGAGFGSAVTVVGETVLVSAPGEGAGVVYVFSRDADGTGLERSRLTAPDGVDQGFGALLATDGQTLLVGAPGPRGATGSVFGYEMEGGVWTAAGRLEVEDLPERSGYPSALAVRDGAAYVGAAGFDGRAGAVFVFTRSVGSEWTYGTRLGPIIADRGAQFGASLAYAGPKLLVGAPGTHDGLGVIYELGRDENGRPDVDVLTSLTAGDGAGFGGSTVVSDGVAVVGATGVDERAGAAVVFAVAPDGAWNEQGTVVNEMRGFPALTGDEIHCVEGQAALFECLDVNITAFLPIKDIGGARGTRVNDIWGWTDPENGIEYAIVGRTNGTSFVNVSDPHNPVFVGDLPKTAGSRSSIWRDMKVYKDHVYIVADNAGAHGVQVLDMRQLRNFRGQPMALEATYRYDGIHSAHNIVLNEETGFAYTVGNSGGGETCGGGLHMLDLTDPARPGFAGCFADPKTGRRGTGYSHDAQCVIYQGPDAEHRGKEICMGSNETALSIADVTNKDAPVTIAMSTYPKVAYAHQGWLTEDHRYFYMNDEGDEPQGLVEGTRTLVWDVQDLDDPILVNEYIAKTTATDHNLYVRGNTMYQSNYAAGLRILDISDPENPVEIGFFDTSPYQGGASWSNYPFFESGVIAVTGTGDGLFLLKNVARRNLIP